MATHHYPHVIGGEDTRETAYARLVVGRAGNLDALVDITAECLPPRPACPARVRDLKKLAKGQGELARCGSYSDSMSEQYAANERSMMHASHLAGIDTIRVPRNVFASRAGTVLMAFEASLTQSSKEGLPGLIRLLDLPSGRLLNEWSSSRAPLDRPGTGVERFSSVHLGRPLAFSSDGERVLLLHAQGYSMPLLAECRLDENLSELAQGAVLHPGAIVGCQDGWLALSDGYARWFGPGLKPLAECRLPRGSLEWGMSVAPDGHLIAVPASVGGDVFVVSRDGGKARRFSPHRGARRDDFAQVDLSDCGGWMVSRCRREVVLTRLADGVSWPVAAVDDAVLQDASFGGYVVRSNVPAAVAFIGSKLLAVESSTVRELSLAEGTGAFVSQHGQPGARRPIRVNRSMDFDTLLRTARLQNQSAALAQFHSPAIQIKTKPLKASGWLMPTERGAPPLGGSRIGGWPDLAAGSAWPTWQDRPMAFLAQISLGEAHAKQPGLRLPSRGLLSFFLGCSPDTYTKDADPRSRFMMDIMVGTEASDCDAWRVLYQSEVDALQRRICPHDPLPELVEPCALGFQARGLGLPDESSLAYEQLLAGMSTSEQEDYNDLIGQLQPEDDDFSEQLMGYPQLIQGTPPEMMCELSARGMNPWNYPEPAAPNYLDLATGASEWTLLLQLTSNPDADFCWGDGGHFYFYGDREAMARGDFSRVWVNFEN